MSDVDGDRHPWLRQRKEPERDHELFVAYRTLQGAERSLERVATDAGMTVGAVRRIAARRRWEDRALAYDRHLDEQRVDEERKARAQMTRNHLAIASTLQHLGLRELNKRIKKSEKAAEDEPTIATKDAMDLVERGVRLERLNRELPETTTGFVGSIDGGGSAREWVLSRLNRMAELEKPKPPADDGSINADESVDSE